MNFLSFLVNRRSARITKWLSTWTTECESFYKIRAHSSVRSRHSTNTWIWFSATAKNSEKFVQRTANCQSAKRNVCLDLSCCEVKISSRWQLKDHHHQKKVCHAYHFQAQQLVQVWAELLVVVFQPICRAFQLDFKDLSVVSVDHHNNVSLLKNNVIRRIDR